MVEPEEECDDARGLIVVEPEEEWGAAQEEGSWGLQWGFSSDGQHQPNLDERPCEPTKQQSHPVRVCRYLSGFSQHMSALLELGGRQVPL